MSVYVPTNVCMHMHVMMLVLLPVCTSGCPANEADSSGQNPQKMAKTMGRKDLMKEVKKLSTFQDKASRGKVKGFTEPWLVQVRATRCMCVHIHGRILLPQPLSIFYMLHYVYVLYIRMYTQCIEVPHHNATDMSYW